MKKVIALCAAGLLAVMGLIAGLAAPANAAEPRPFTYNCNEINIAVPGNLNPATPANLTPNKVKVTVNNVVVVPFTPYGTSYTKQITFANPTVRNDVSITVVRWDRKTTIYGVGTIPCPAVTAKK